MAVRLKEKYDGEIIAALREQFGYENIMQVPRLEKIVVNMGVGDAIADAKMMDAAVAELALITGQKPVIRKARKSISNFKLRAGVNIGCMVTLRGRFMWEFMDRLFNIAIPRIRDFRGLSPSRQVRQLYARHPRTDHLPRSGFGQVTRVRMNVTFVIKNATSAEESRALLRSRACPSPTETGENTTPGGCPRQGVRNWPRQAKSRR